jgi:hypothetical protein
MDSNAGHLKAEPGGKGDDPAEGEVGRGHKSKDQWEVLTRETKLNPDIEQDLIDLSNRGFEEKHGIKVPPGAYVTSHDVFDLPRVSAQTVQGVADSLSDFTIEDFNRDQVRVAAGEFADDPGERDAESRLLDALSRLNQKGLDGAQIQRARDDAQAALSNLDPTIGEGDSRSA